jgi:hypothetical protein
MINPSPWREAILSLLLIPLLFACAFIGAAL